MLAAAIPGTSFVDPLATVDPAVGEASAAPQDGEPPSANGTEAAG